MSDADRFADPQVRRRVRRVMLHNLLISMVVGLLTLAVMTLLYLVTPEPDPAESLGTAGLIGFGVVCLLLYSTLSMFAVVRLRRSPRPVIEGGAYLIVLIALIIYGYAWLYLSMSIADGGSFTEPLDKATAVYFTVTVLSTVGFGDITPASQLARMVVTTQMLVGLTVITLAVRVIIGSVSSAARANQDRVAAADGP